MLRRFGFRRILPISQCALFLFLVGLGAWQLDRVSSKPRVRPVVLQEGSGLPEWHPERQSMPSPWLIAIALNVPATMLGALMAGLLRIGSNLGGLICSAPFVLILWQLVGRWLDRQIGLLPCRPPGKGTQIACWVGIVLAAILLGIGLLAVRSHSELNAEVLSLAVGWLAWSATLFLMCFLTLRRRPEFGLP